MLGVAYGLALFDMVPGPGIPSASARGGGIVYPITTQSIASAYKSELGPTARKAGAFLMICVSQIGAIICAMFLIAMTGNPLIAELSFSQRIQINWMTWFLGAIVPGILALVIIPVCLYLKKYWHSTSFC